MLKDIVEVTPLENYHLRIRFEDGIDGDVDVSQLVKFTGVFAPLVEEVFFQRVRLDPELGSICWENGADLDTDVLYALISGEPLPSFETLVHVL
ncbi:MAG: DUF2442 domain-containing protein [Leptolinea sp.]